MQVIELVEFILMTLLVIKQYIENLWYLIFYSLGSSMLLQIIASWKWLWELITWKMVLTIEILQMKLANNFSFAKIGEICFSPVKLFYTSLYDNLNVSKLQQKNLKSENCFPFNQCLKSFSRNNGLKKHRVTQTTEETNSPIFAINVFCVCT